jgi:hypothetical protein
LVEARGTGCLPATAAKTVAVNVCLQRERIARGTGMPHVLTSIVGYDRLQKSTDTSIARLYSASCVESWCNDFLKWYEHSVARDVGVKTCVQLSIEFTNKRLSGSYRAGALVPLCHAPCHSSLALSYTSANYQRGSAPVFAGIN